MHPHAGDTRSFLRLMMSTQYGVFVTWYVSLLMMAEGAALVFVGELGDACSAAQKACSMLETSAAPPGSAPLPAAATASGIEPSPGMD